MMVSYWRRIAAPIVARALADHAGKAEAEVPPRCGRLIHSARESIIRTESGSTRSGFRWGAGSWMVVSGRPRDGSQNRRILGRLRCSHEH
jgi:hypothetical protein